MQEQSVTGTARDVDESAQTQAEDAQAQVEEAPPPPRSLAQRASDALSILASRRWLHPALVGVLMLVCAALYSGYALLQYWHYRQFGWDLGIFD